MVRIITSDYYCLQMMEMKTWTIVVRCVNLVSSFVLVGFQIWFMVEMIIANKQRPGQIVIQIFAPIFLMLIAALTISSEFKYKKVVEYFKFLQSVVGLGMFNFFLASILSFEFSTLHETFAIVVSSIYMAIGLTFFVLACLKPKSDDDEYAAMNSRS